MDRVSRRRKIVPPDEFYSEEYPIELPDYEVKDGYER